MAAVIKIVDSLIINLLFKSASPFPKEKLIEHLKEAGFEEVAPSFPQFPEPAGAIAKRKGVKVNYVPENGVIGVSGADTPQVMSSFEELLNVLNGELPVEDTMKLCETVFTAKIESEKMPKETINAFVGPGKLKSFEKVFGEETMISTIRLFPTHGSGIREDTEWFDVVVEPAVLLPRLYHMRVVYRSASLKKVLEFSNSIQKNALKIIDAIEKGG